MKIALCTRNGDNPAIRLLNDYLGSHGHEVTVVTDPRALLDPSSGRGKAFDVGFWRPDSRDEEVAAFARQGADILEGQGVRFLNSLASSDRATNKFVSYALFRSRDLLSPPTWVPPQEWDSGTDIPPGPKIVKPVGGKQGRGVKFAESLDAALDDLRHRDRLCILQQPIRWTKQLRVVATPDRWIRVYEQASATVESEKSVARFDAEAARVVEDPEDAVVLMGREMVRAVGGDLMRADLLMDNAARLFALEVNASFGFPHDDERVLKSFLTEMQRVAERS